MSNVTRYVFIEGQVCAEPVAPKWEFATRYVVAGAYSALEAECERLREANRVQLEMAAVHGEAAARVIRERDALRAQLEAIRAAGGEAVAWAIADDPQQIGGFAPIYYSLDDAKRWADGKNIIPLCDQRIVAAMAAELQTWKAEVKAQQELYADAMIAIGQALGIDVSDEPRCKHVAAEAAQVRAELAAIKAQEHVAEVVWIDPDAGLVRARPGYRYVDFSEAWIESVPLGTKLYALPPLAGQVSVPVDLLVRLEQWVVADCTALTELQELLAEAVELRALLATPSMEVKS